MPVKIRLARHGKKNKPFYFIVVADGRAPRDGRFIERIGSYNPNTNPAFIELDFDKALNWLQKGAQPTDTCRTILSHEGVLMKKHLLEGAKKNAFTLEEAEVKFQNWLNEKLNTTETQKEKLSNLKSEEQRKLFDAEKKVREERAQAIAKKYSEPAKPADVEEPAEPTEVVEEVVAEAVETSDSEPSTEEQTATTEAVTEAVAEAVETSDSEPSTEEQTATTEAVAEAVAEAVETTDSEPSTEEQTATTEVVEEAVVKAAKVEKTKAEASTEETKTTES